MAVVGCQFWGNFVPSLVIDNIYILLIQEQHVLQNYCTSLRCHVVQNGSVGSHRLHTCMCLIRPRSVGTESTVGIDPARNVTLFYIENHRQEAFRPEFSLNEETLS